MKPPRCSKCGRPLTNPESITRGMGPECAGTTGRGRRSHVHSRHARNGKPYAVSLSLAQIPLLPVFSPDPDEPHEREHGSAFPSPV